MDANDNTNIYTEIWNFELKQITRILSTTYTETKFDLKHIENFYDILGYSWVKVVKKYRNFINFLEKELNFILKECWEEGFKDFLYLFPPTKFKKKSWRKKKVLKKSLKKIKKTKKNWS